MSREVRRVPPSWQHPQTAEWDPIKRRVVKRYQPLYDEDYASACRHWREDYAAWEGGERQSYFRETGRDMEFWDYEGPPPDKKYYRPTWRDDERTHYQMYESTSEGTPISPVFATPEELARWLADTGASAFADMTATYEEWLEVASGRSTVSAVAVVDDKGGLQKWMSGVAALSENKEVDCEPY